MPIVLVLDQRDSRSEKDLVQAWSRQLNRVMADQLKLCFDRTAGDEMQALIGEPEALGTIARRIAASGQWTMGVGVGAVETPLPDSVREGRGPAFWAARDAIQVAKTQRSTRPLAVKSADEHASTAEEVVALSLDRCLGALAFIVSRRTEKQREAADTYYEADYSVRAVIDELKLSPQGAYQRLNAAGTQEEKELIELATELARPVVDS